VLLAPALMLVALAGASYGIILKNAIDGLSAGQRGVALWAPAAIVGVTALRAFAIWAQAILSQGLALKVLRDIQGAMFASLMGADYARFLREDTGRLVSRFTNDINVVSEGLVRGVQAVLRDSLTVLGALASMFYFDWALALYAIGVFALAGRPLAAIARRARTQTEAAQAQLGELTALLSEQLGAARVIKTYRLEARENARAQAAFERRRKLAMKLARNRAIADPLLEVLGGAALAGVIAIAGWRMSAGAMTLGDLLGMVAAVGVAAPAARALGAFNTVLNEALAALSRIFTLLDEAPRVTDAPDARPLQVDQGAVAFRNVSFGYDGVSVLRDVSFTARRGEMVALVGPSGAGKSTAFNLLARLYDAQSGAVSIDGQDVRAVTLASLRDALALVSQDAALFSDTISANIALGKDNADAAAIERAARAAAAHEFIAALPHGYDALAGERGAKLSGGDRQRVALARAILREAPILLLDEATSALDAQAEAAVQDALAALRADRTILVIAHRLATVRSADLILVLDKGEIIERGRHDDLLARGGLYARLYALQFQD
jgi:subfamily B ATP-binding cassette protein MsbA